MGLYPGPLGLAARGTAWPTTRTCAQHTATSLLTSLSGLLRTQSQGLSSRPAAPTWAHQQREGKLAPAVPESCTHTGPSEKGEGTLAPAVPKSCTHTGPSEKGEGTLAHLVSGLWVASSSPRGAFSRKKRMLWGRRSWPEILNIINTYPSLQRHPLPKLFTERCNINPYSDFLPEKSILQETPNPCATVPSSSPDALLWPLLPQRPLATSAQSDHSILSTSPCSSPLPQVLPSLTCSQTQKNLPPLLFLPQHYAAKSLQSCPSVWPHRWQPMRLPHPWDSPGKNTGVGCHFLLQCMKVKSQGEVTQSCPTLSNPMDCSLPGFAIHGIFQVRVLEWGAVAFSAHSTIFVLKKKKVLASKQSNSQGLSFK